MLDAHVEPELGEPPGVLQRLHRMHDDHREVDDALRQHDLAARDAGDVEKVVDDLREVLRLATDHRAAARGRLARRRRTLQQRGRVGDGGQRVAQLVPEHRQKLVLGEVRVLGFRTRARLAQQRGVHGFLALAQLVAGLVQRTAHLLDLRDVRALVGVVGGPCRIRLRERARRRGERRDRERDAAAEQECEQQREQAGGPESGRRDDGRAEHRLLDLAGRHPGAERPSGERRGAVRRVVGLAFEPSVLECAFGPFAGALEEARRGARARPAIVVQRTRDDDAVAIVQVERGVLGDRIAMQETQPRAMLDADVEHRCRRAATLDRHGDEREEAVAAIRGGQHAGHHRGPGVDHGLDRRRVGHRVGGEALVAHVRERTAIGRDDPDHRPARLHPRDAREALGERLRILGDGVRSCEAFERTDDRVNLGVHREAQRAHAAEEALLVRLALQLPEAGGHHGAEQRDGQQGREDEDDELRADSHAARGVAATATIARIGRCVNHARARRTHDRLVVRAPEGSRRCVT